MSRIDITTSAAPLSDGMLQTANPLDATLQVVTDNVGNSSTVSLSTTETQINSILRIKTDNAELLDIENSSGNRFNINRDVQKINLDLPEASKFRLEVTLCKTNLKLKLNYLVQQIYQFFSF